MGTAILLKTYTHGECVIFWIINWKRNILLLRRQKLGHVIPYWCCLRQLHLIIASKHTLFPSSASFPDFSGMNHSSASLYNPPSFMCRVLLQLNHLSLVCHFISPIRIKNCYCAIFLTENAKNFQGKECSDKMNYWCFKMKIEFKSEFCSSVGKKNNNNLAENYNKIQRSLSAGQ